MVTPFRSLFYPLTERIDFIRGKRRVLKGHSFFRIGQGNSPDHLAFIGTAWNNGEFAGLSRSQSVLPEQQAESGLAPHPTMTNNAILIDEWLHLGIKVNLPVRIPKPNHQNGEKRKRK